jgi:dephospho-CoA kinase
VPPPPPSAEPVLVGLTGGIAAGKSEALAAFERVGAATLSADSVVHELLESPEVQDRVLERWNGAVLSEGRLDRERVAAIVFEQPEELAWLESTLHPRVAGRIAEWRESLPESVLIAVVEVPLLFETSMEDAFDATVSVVADDSVRAERAGGRGTLLLEGRDDRQLPQDEKAARATYVIRNDGSLSELEAEIARLARALAESVRGTA